MGLVVFGDWSVSSLGDTGGSTLRLAFAGRAGSSCGASAGYAKPAITAPTMGATQNSQSCASAQPPTKKAGPVDRAGVVIFLALGFAFHPIVIGVPVFGA